MFGRCASYFLSEAIILTNIGSYQTLNYVSLGSLLCTLIFALFLPNVTWREVVNRQIESNIIKPNEQIPDNYLKFLRRQLNHLIGSAKIVFSNRYVLKWSICYSLFLCGYLQIGNYIQPLWSIAEEKKNQIYNALIEGTIPLMSIFAIMPIQSEWIDFNKYGEAIIVFSTLLQALTLFVSQMMTRIWSMYLMYGVYRITYQIVGTISQ